MTRLRFLVPVLVLAAAGCSHSRSSGDAGPYDGPRLPPPAPPPTGALLEAYNAISDAATAICPCLVPAEYDTVDQCTADLRPNMTESACASSAYSTMRSGELDMDLRCLAGLYQSVGNCVRTMGCSAAMTCLSMITECPSTPTMQMFDDAVDACLSGP